MVSRENLFRLKLGHETESASLAPMPTVEDSFLPPPWAFLCHTKAENEA